MVSPYDPAVEVQPQPETEAPESPEMARARQLAAAVDALEQTLDLDNAPQPRSISGKRRSDRLADSRQLLESRIAAIPDFERHSRKCQVCHSRYVEEIEEAYYNWSSAQWIINAFNISYDDAVYRHARAIGLDIRRRKNVAIAVEKLIEKVDEVTVTSSTVLRAVRALSCLNNDGRWTDPPTTHIVLTNKDLPKHTSVTANPSTQAGSTSSTEQREPLDGLDSASTASTNDADSMTSSSIETASTSANRENAATNSFTSSGRSEPLNGCDGGNSTAATHTVAPENKSTGVTSPSSERSEPIRAGDITIPGNGSFFKVEPQASSLESPEPNRGTYEKLEIAATH